MGARVEERQSLVLTVVIHKPAADLAQRGAIHSAAVDSRDAAAALGVNLAREDDLLVLSIPQPILLEQRDEVGAIGNAENPLDSRSPRAGPHERRIGALAAQRT